MYYTSATIFPPFFFCVVFCFFPEAACTATRSTEASLHASQHARDTIATVAGADRAAGRTTEGGAPQGGWEGGGPVEETEAADFANYFYSYAELDHQKQMLEDDRYIIMPWQHWV